MSKISKFLKIILFSLDGILILGLLSYSIILLALNKSLDPAEISGMAEAAVQRAFWSRLASQMGAICGAVYILGHVLIIYNAPRKKISFSAKELSAYFLVQLIIMLLCVLPFGLFDRMHFSDYTVNMWNIMGITALMFFVSLFKMKEK